MAGDQLSVPAQDRGRGDEQPEALRRGFPGGDLGQPGGFGADRGQTQLAGGGADRGTGGLVAAGGHLVAGSRRG